MCFAADVFVSVGVPYSPASQPPHQQTPPSGLKPRHIKLFNLNIFILSILKIFRQKNMLLLPKSRINNAEATARRMLCIVQKLNQGTIRQRGCNPSRQAGFVRLLLSVAEGFGSFLPCPDERSGTRGRSKKEQ